MQFRVVVHPLYEKLAIALFVLEVALQRRYQVANSIVVHDKSDRYPVVTVERDAVDHERDFIAKGTTLGQHPTVEHRLETVVAPPGHMVAAVSYTHLTLPTKA